MAQLDQGRRFAIVDHRKGENLNDVADNSFASLVEKGRLLFSVPRRDVRKWANYVDREVKSRPGSTRVSVIREHISTLDEKSGPMTGIAGILVAGCAILGNALFCQTIIHNYLSNKRYTVIILRLKRKSKVQYEYE